MKKTISTLGALALLAVSAQTHAVENLNSLPLWSESDIEGFGFIEQLNSIDFYPATTGIELIGYSDTVSAETSSSNSRMVWKQRFQVRNAATGAQLSQFTLTTKSDWYPNDDSTFDYFCGDEYAGDLLPDNTIDDCDASVSIGVAETAGGGRYLVVATGVIIDYWDGISIDDVADVYKLHVYNLSNGNLAWAKSWALESPGGAGGDWELDVALSGINDYINADGTDELRIAQGREQGPNWRTRYQYFNIETGALIDTVAFSTAYP